MINFNNQDQMKLNKTMVLLSRGSKQGGNTFLKQFANKLSTDKENEQFQRRVQQQSKEIKKQRRPSRMEDSNNNFFKMGGFLQKTVLMEKLRKKKNMQQTSLQDSINSDVHDENDNQDKMRHLLLAVSELDQKHRIEKAVRHLRDALNLRPVRNDIDTTKWNIIQYIYYFQISSSWHMFLFLLSMTYLILSYFEPANENDTTFSLFEPIVAYEQIIMGLFISDLVMCFIHRCSDYDRPFVDQFIKNFKFLSQLFIVSFLTFDMIYFYSVFPTSAGRFFRFLRPCKLINQSMISNYDQLLFSASLVLMLLYSKELRRTFKSILLSFQQIFQLFIFYILVCIVFALIALYFIGQNVDYVTDDFQTNYQDFLGTVNILYSLISFDGYPDCMVPAYKSSPYYLIYFFIYLWMLLLVFVPVPVAVVFDAFRNHRSSMVVIDRIKQREALLATFVCLDFNNNKTMNQLTFTELIQNLYYHQKRMVKRIKSLYLMIDLNDSNSVSLNEFFDLVDIIEENSSKFAPPLFPDSILWDRFRKFVNKRFKFKSIAKSTWFESIMLLLVLFNTLIYIFSNIVTDQDTLDIFDLIDNILFWIYVGEAILKIIGLGIEKYFQDDWNQFDFIMVCSSGFSDTLQNTITVLRSAKSAKAGQLVRISKVNQVFRVFKAAKTIKFMTALAEPFNQVRKLISKIFMCIPLSKSLFQKIKKQGNIFTLLFLVVKLVPIILMIMYLYGLIGIVIFNTKTNQIIKADSPYNSNSYTDFQSFFGSQLILFQVMIEANWSTYTYDYAWKFDNLVQAVLYFDTFHMIVQLILLSLIRGLKFNFLNDVNNFFLSHFVKKRLILGIIWQVFTVVDHFMKQQNKEEEYINQQLDNLDDKQNKTNKIEEFRMATLDNVVVDLNKNEGNNQDKSGISQKIISQTKEKEYDTLSERIQQYQNILLKIAEKYLKAGFTNNQNENQKFLGELDLSDLKHSTSEQDINFLIGKVDNQFNNVDPIQQELDSDLPNKHINISEQLIKKQQQEESLQKCYISTESNTESIKHTLQDNNLVAVQNKREEQISKNQQEKQQQEIESPKQKMHHKVKFFEDISINQKEGDKKEESFQLKIFNQPQEPAIADKSRQSQTMIDVNFDFKFEDNIFLNSKFHNLDTNNNNNLIQTNELSFRPNLQAANPQNTIRVKLEEDDQNKQTIPNITSQFDYMQFTAGQDIQYLLDKSVMGPNVFNNDRPEMKPNVMSRTNSLDESANNASIFQTMQFNNNSSIVSPLKGSRFLKNGSSILDEDISIIKEKRYQDQIFEMRRKFKSLKFIINNQKALKKEKHAQQMRSSPNQNQTNIQFDINQEFFDSDDQVGMKVYLGQIYQSLQQGDIQIKEENQEEQKIKTFFDQKQTQQNQEEDEDQGINQNYIMKKALLKEANMDLVKKIEIDYFQTTYGTFFNIFHEVDVLPIMKMEGFIMYNLQRILRHKRMDFSEFFKVLQTMEQSISDMLFKTGSLFKFIFQDSQDNWFCMSSTQENDTIMPCLLSQGPWNYLESVFHHEKQIYISRNLFSTNSEVMSQLLIQFYENLQILAKSLDKDMEFLNLHPEKNVFDFFSLYFSNNIQDEVISETYQLLREKMKTYDIKIPVYIKKIMIFVVSYIGEQVDDDQVEPEKHQLRNTKVKKTEYQFEDKQKEGKIDNKPQIEIHALRTKESSEQDKLNSSSYLPLSYIIQFLKSFQDLLALYRSHFFIKVTQFLNQQMRQGFEEFKLNQNPKSPEILPRKSQN